MQKIVDHSLTSTARARGSRVVAIVADDLTGATDSAVQFSREGWEARLLLDEPEFAAQAPLGVRNLLLAVTADNRAVAAPDAARITGESVRLVQRQGAGFVFVKVDSTMRGSVAAQIAGALEAWSVGHPDAIAVVCPAYPGMGRTVVDNTLLVEGVPVSETPIGIDPVTPVLTSDLTELIPGSVPLASLGVDEVADAVTAAVESAGSGGPTVFTVDAVTDEDLAHLAHAIAEHAGSVIPVGSAGLAMALAREWGDVPREVRATVPASTLPTRSRRILVQVTSLNAVSRRQLAVLRAGIPSDKYLELAPDLQAVSTRLAMRVWAGVRGHEFGDYDVVVVSAPEQRADNAGTQAAQEIAANLSTLTAELLLTGQFGAVGFVGGDGARAALSELGVSAVRVLDTLEEGIPLSETVDGLVPGTTIFTKAGGFGTPNSLLDAVTRIGHSQTGSINV